MINDEIVEAAKSVVGFCANPRDPELRQKYLELIAPGEPGAKANDMANASGCALVVAGIYRMIGIKHDKIDKPYIFGTAVSRLVTLAHKPEVNAWASYPWPPGIDEEPGDMLLVGNNGTGGVEHVYIVGNVSKNEAGETIIESVDGGQRDSAKYQIILAKKRVRRKDRDIVFQGTDPGSSTAGGRVIVGRVIAARLESLRG